MRLLRSIIHLILFVGLIAGLTACGGGGGGTTAPAAPTGLIAAATSTSSIDLNWMDNSTDEVNFVVQRSTISGSGYVTIDTLGANTTSYADTTGLSASTTYFYQVFATNSMGDSGFSNEASATTSSVGTPPSVTLYTRDHTAISDIDTTFIPIGADWVLVDVDKDGLEDVLFWGGLNELNSTNPVLGLIFHNLGGDRYELIEAKSIILGGLRDVQNGKLLKSELDGDSFFDVVIVNGGIDVAPFPGEPNTLILSSLSSKLLVSNTIFPTVSDFSHGAAAGDIDGDGDNDLFFANICCGNIGSYFLLNDGIGNFSFDQSLPGDVINTNMTGYFVLAAKILDVDNDGFSDLVLGAGAGSTNLPGGGLVLLNDGTGDFTVKPPINFPPGLAVPSTITIEILPIDLNSDGLTDLVLAQTFDYSEGHLQVLISDGTGSYSDESFRIQSNIGLDTTVAFKLAPIDLESDGDIDILVQRNDVGQVDSTILLNDGSGFFTEIDFGSTFPVPSYPGGSIHFGDLPNDLILIPIIGASGNLTFISIRYDCTAGNSQIGCTNWHWDTFLFK